GEQDVPVAAGCAIDDPGMPPLWPWRDAARSVPALAGVLDGAAGSAGESPAPAADSASARFVMFTEACQALADAAAERGLLVVLEDLQWADRTSLLLLRHLAGGLARTTPVVGAAVREAPAPAAGRSAARAAARRQHPADSAYRVVAVRYRAMVAVAGNRGRRGRAGGPAVDGYRRQSTVRADAGG